MNELSFYSLGLNQIAEHLGLSPPSALAVVKELRVQEDEDMFKEIQIGKARYRRYSQKGLEVLRDRLPDLDLDEVWRRHKPIGRRKNQ